MKTKLKNVIKNNFIYIIMIIAIIAGGVVVSLKGFEYSIENMDHQRLEIILDTQYNEEEMDDIINQATNDRYILRTSSLFKTIVAIDSKEFTDEEINNILNKINEKYGTDYSIKNLKLSEIIEKYNLSDIENMEDKEIEDTISKIKEEYNLDYTKEELADTESMKVDLTKIKGISILDTLKKFFVPTVVAVVLILLFIELRALKFDKLIFIKDLVKLLITELFLVAVVAIIRIPLSSLVVTTIVTVGIAELLAFNIQNEKIIKRNKEKEENE